MAWLLLVTIIIVAGSAFMVKRLALKSTLDCWLTLGLFSLAGQILILLVAGVCLKQLNRPTVLFLAVAWAGVGLLLSADALSGIKTTRPNFYQQLLRGLSILSSACKHNPPLKVVGLILLLSFIAVGLGVVYLPPYAWDEIWYHLPPMANWYQQGAIAQLPEALQWQDYNPLQVDANQLALDCSVAFNWANVYPLNAELNALLTMVMLDNDMLADAAQLPYVLLGALATLGLCRLAGARLTTALLAAMLFLLTPAVLAHLRVAYADASFAAMVATTLYFFLKWQIKLEAQYALLFGLATGLMMGIKSTGLAFAGVFCLASLVYGLWQCQRQKIKCPQLCRQAGLFLLVMIATGSFWYLRTWWLYGNPIYPVTVALPGWSLPGLGSVDQLFMNHNTPDNYRGRSLLLNVLISWLELGEETYNYYSRTRGFGPFWAALALPALIPFTYNALKQRQTPVIWMMGITLLLLLVQPAVWWPRYALYVVPVGLAAWAWLYERLQAKVRLAVTLLMIFNIVVSSGLVLAETLDKLPLAMKKASSCRTFGQLYYQDYAWVDSIPPSNIGYTPMAWIYPLYGGLQHRVQLIDGSTAESWRKAIRQQKVDYVVIKPDYSHYELWAQDSADLLQIYQKGELINVYKVKH